KTIILSTHIMQEVEAVCNHVIIINKGKIVANDTLAALRGKNNGNTLENVFISLTNNN
ncbi:MAG: yxlF 1, partial [Mucilaginibacter sp.]|nr:yxlF 1 [Mucilaginibacter sp.]